jgi:hypothetical protein
MPPTDEGTTTPARNPSAAHKPSRDRQPRCRTQPAQAGRQPSFNQQELELKTNTQLTREIHTLTTELHNRLLPRRTRQRS